MLATPMPDFLTLPNRSIKPRDLGITHVVDRGCTASVTRELIRQAGHIIDIWKFGWGISYVDPDARSKVAALRAAGVQTCVGGTLLEIAWLQQKTEAFFGFAEEFGFDCIEVSDGSCAMPLDEKSKLISRGRELGFKVLSEVGCKDPDQTMEASDWLRAVEADLSAGAYWVVAEGRESGTVGIYQPDGAVKSELIDALQSSPFANRVIYEAPRRTQQVYLLSQMGNAVNLGNIQIDDVLALETLRLGLRADTIHTDLTPC